MKKKYRYLVYKLYSWGIKKKNDTPVANVIFTLTVVHCFQLLALYSIINKFFNIPNFLSYINKLFIIIFFFVFSVLHYFLLYNKERWQRYIEEFSSESPSESKKGNILVIAYLIGSILLFFILMPMLFGT